MLSDNQVSYITATRQNYKVEVDICGDSVDIQEMLRQIIKITFIYLNQYQDIDLRYVKKIMEALLTDSYYSGACEAVSARKRRNRKKVKNED